MLKKINYQHMLVDVAGIVITFFAALFLRVNPAEARTFLPAMLHLLPIVVICRLVGFIYFETSNIIWRYVAAVDAFQLAKSIAASTLSIVTISYLFSFAVVPRSVFLIDAFLAISLLCGLRISRRLFFEYQTSSELKKFGERTLIFGAGATGQGLLKRLLVAESLRMHVVGFMDDDVKKVGRSISGFQVFGGINRLKAVIDDMQIRKVVVAISQPDPEFLKELVAICSHYEIKPVLMNTSDAADLGRAFREIELRDLLLRPPHKIDLTSTQQMIRGKRVLITGAGGSIGSELSRQVLGFQPSRLILLDHSEFNLYNIDVELRRDSTYEAVVVPSLVDIKDAEALAQVFQTYSPEIIIHAAAYKHVHLVEQNPFTAILNNIMGTKNLLQLSEQHQIENFVLISSDKAVNPAGVMGSTKRVCEIMTGLMGVKTRKSYCAVRFGNVLGSSGSLIPTFKKQIQDGGPLTLTHPEIERYFMLIEEAVSLVLKAASISKPGDINVLKMGQPVKILDLAKSLLHLMGKTEDEVKFQIIGLRPGEKMFEELYISGNELGTEHPDILVVPKGDEFPPDFSTQVFQFEVDDMIKSAQTGNKDALYVLSRIVNSNYEHPTFHGQLKGLNKNKTNPKDS